MAALPPQARDAVFGDSNPSSNRGSNNSASSSGSASRAGPAPSSGELNSTAASTLSSTTSGYVGLINDGSAPGADGRRRVDSDSVAHGADAGSSASHASSISRLHANLGGSSHPGHSSLNSVASSGSSASAALRAISLHNSVAPLASPAPSLPLSPSSSNSNSLYQPISLADALGRSQGDGSRALDEVLAERNKYCMEAGKLSNENIRIWNLMGKIRKENELLKSRLALAAAPQAGASSMEPPSTPLAGEGVARSSPLAALNVSAGDSYAARPRAAGPDAMVAPNAGGPPQDAATARGPSYSTSSPPLAAAALAPSRSAGPPFSLGGGALPSSVSMPFGMSSTPSTPRSSNWNATALPRRSSDAPLSPGALSVMQQRAAAKALQQQQQGQQQDNPAPRDALAGSRPDMSRQDTQRSHETFEGLATANGSSDRKSHHQEEEHDAPSNVQTAQPEGVNASGGEAEPSQDDDTSIHAVTASSSIASSLAQQRESGQTPAVSVPTRDRLLHQPRDSIGSIASSSHGGHGRHDSGDPDVTASPRFRRKDFGHDPAMMVASPSNGSMRSRTGPKMEPRQPVVVDRDSDDDSGLSLTQALAAMARTAPPGHRNDAPSVPQPSLDNRSLQQTTVKVKGSNIRAGERGKEVLSFFLVVSVGVVTVGGTSAAPTSWRIEKSYPDIVALDAKIKHRHGKTAVRKMSVPGAQLPDRALLKDHAPSKVDMRKSMLDAFFRNLLSITLPDKDDLCTFLCTDTVPVREQRNATGLFKEGFLTKKGQNLGRWVTRFYSLDGARLDYFEGRGGALLGSINVRGAQIGRQQKTAQSEMDENSYRHAFLVLERKKGGSSAAANDMSGMGAEASQLVRHVLCAESDEERDEWVDVLVRAIAEIDRQEGRVPAATSTSGAAPLQTDGAEKPVRKDSQNAHAIGTAEAEQVRPAPVAAVLPPSSQSSRTAPPATQSPARMKRSGSLSRRLNKSRDGSGPASSADEGHLVPSASSQTLNDGSRDAGLTSSSSSQGQHASRQDRPSISGPMNGAPIPTGYKFGARDEDTRRDAAGATSAGREGAAVGSAVDRRRFWHRFGGGPSTDRKSDGREMRGPVFGVPLSDSIASSSVTQGLALPSVVYRCIEYLEQKNAIMEEGIYRMSGSSADVKALRERFNVEGDVDLLAHDSVAPSGSGKRPNSRDGGGNDGSRRGFGQHDPHAVAGLLKTFLRELPTSVLTRELHLEFMRVNEIADWKERVRELGHLVSALPLANYSLLRTLCRHLIKVISYQDVNKMTMRNVGIVFSPTLGIPAGVFALFLTSFDYCFWTDARGEPAPKEVEDEAIAGNVSTQNDAQVPMSPDDPQHSQENGSRAAPPDRMSSLNSAGNAAAARKRSNRNSLNYSQDEADRLMGRMPLGQHKIMATHPEDPTSYDADADFMGGPQAGALSFDAMLALSGQQNTGRNFADTNNSTARRYAESPNAVSSAAPTSPAPAAVA